MVLSEDLKIVMVLLEANKKCTRNLGNIRKRNIGEFSENSYSRRQTK